MAGRVSHDIIEALIAGSSSSSQGRVSHDAIEVLIPIITRSPATPVGAGVTHRVTEALFAADTKARVTYDVIEVLCLPGLETGQGGGGYPTETSFGYAV